MYQIETQFMYLCITRLEKYQTKTKTIIYVYIKLWITNDNLFFSNPNQHIFPPVKVLLNSIDLLLFQLLTTLFYP